MAPRPTNPALVAEKKKEREIVTTFEGLVEALHRETERLRAVDTYLNDMGYGQGKRDAYLAPVPKMLEVKGG